MAASLTDAAWLHWMESLMNSSARPDSASPQESDGFCCFLDEQPSHLVPETLLGRQLAGQESGTTLSFNPYCYLQGQGPPPPELRHFEQILPETTRPGARLLWVRHPGMDCWNPFWVSPQLEDTIHRMREDRSEIANLPVAFRSVLQQTDILVSSWHAEERCAAWRTTAERCRRKFQTDGYAPISGLIHPFHLGELRRYFRRQIRTGKVRLGDGQSPRRYICHNDLAARFFHIQLRKAVSELVGERMKPSYVYLASYQSGARLEEHTDRAQCEFSITLCLDYTPEPKGVAPWPLYLTTRRGTTTICQALGDGLLYRGRELPHYRKTLAAGNTSTSIFFHYVAENFYGPLE
jgi:hypothetical protein